MCGRNEGRATGSGRWKRPMSPRRSRARRRARGQESPATVPLAPSRMVRPGRGRLVPAFLASGQRRDEPRGDLPEGRGRVGSSDPSHVDRRASLSVPRDGAPPARAGLHGGADPTAMWPGNRGRAPLPRWRQDPSLPREEKKAKREEPGCKASSGGHREPGWDSSSAQSNIGRERGNDSSSEDGGPEARCAEALEQNERQRRTTYACQRCSDCERERRPRTIGHNAHHAQYRPEQEPSDTRDEPHRAPPCGRVTHVAVKRDDVQGNEAARHESPDARSVERPGRGGAQVVPQAAPAAGVGLNRK